jgi:membrane protease YdiL (CAAX protease family)
LFFGATFVWTWGCYLPIVLGGHDPYAWPWLGLFIAGGLGPSLVGVLLVLFTFTPAQRRDFWRRCFSPRLIGLRWWLVIVLVFPCLWALAVGYDLALGGAPPGQEQLAALGAAPALWPLVAFISFMSGPWSEEFGWRGYALDPLIRRFGTVTGSVVLGAVWGLWHLPLYGMPATWHGQMGFRLAGFWTFLIFSIGLALLMAWVYTHTQRSILAALLLHFASNFTAQLLAPVSDRAEMARAALVLAVGFTGCLLAARRARPAATLAGQRDVGSHSTGPGAVRRVG